jgi:antitoxin component YwqK of YwqJK toxin-antitoxin module
MRKFPLFFLIVLFGCARDQVIEVRPIVPPPPSIPKTENVEVIEEGDQIKTKVRYFSGTPKEEMVEQGPERKLVTWYETASPKSVEIYRGEALVSGKYYNFENKLESEVKEGSGFRVMRSESGELFSTDTIEKGQMVKRTTYHENGTPKEIASYSQGVVDGERKTFLESGEPKTIEDWEGGAQHGQTVTFQEGERYAEIPYVKGAKHGKEKRYRQGKTLIEEITWVDDKRNGPSFTYLGESVKTDYYIEGRQVSKKQFEEQEKD